MSDVLDILAFRSAQLDEMRRAPEMPAGWRDDLAGVAVALRGVRARLESSSSPTPSPRADGVPVAWAIMTGRGDIYDVAIKQDTFTRKLAMLSIMKNLEGHPFTLVPLYAGAAPTPAVTLSKTAQAMLVLLSQSPDGMDEQRMANLLYMADVLSRQYLGKPITEIEWHRGPNGAAGSAPPSVAGVSEELERWRAMREVLHVCSVTPSSGYYYVTADFIMDKKPANIDAFADTVRAARTAPAPRDETPPLVTGTEYGA